LISSKGATKIESDEEIDMVIESLKYISENLGDKIKLFGNKSRTYLDKDNINKYDLLSQVKEQLKIHRFLYKTMKRKAYECPFYKEDKNQLRYFKIFYDENKINKPKQVTLSYHLDEKTKGKIIYE